jgi:hypothetical protein
MTVKTILLALALSVFTALGLTPAKAHSWYPNECSSSHDCMPADRMYTDTGGNRILVVGQRRVWVPPGFAVRSSPDNRIHVCFTDDVWGYQAPRCVFMPANS